MRWIASFSLSRSLSRFQFYYKRNKCCWRKTDFLRCLPKKSHSLWMNNKSHGTFRVKMWIMCPGRKIQVVHCLSYFSVIRFRPYQRNRRRIDRKWILLFAFIFVILEMLFAFNAKQFFKHISRVGFNGSLWFVFKSIFSLTHFVFAIFQPFIPHKRVKFPSVRRNERIYNSHFQMKQLTCSLYPICTYKCTNGIYLIISFLFRAPNALLII